MYNYPIFWSFFNILKFKETRHIGPPPHPPTHPTLTKAWCKERVELWKRGALHGILNQTVTDWKYYVLCDIRSRDWLEELMPDDPRVIPIWMSYASGEAPWDPSAASQIKETLPTADQYYLFRADSDDLWHPEVVENTMKIETDEPFILFQKGYIYHRETGVVKNYKSGSGPMHVHIRDANEWPGEQWSEGPHNFVEQQGCLYGAPNMFMVTVHSMNTTTHFNTPQCKDVVSAQETSDVLKAFKLP